jgi:hypothetical protein
MGAPVNPPPRTLCWQGWQIALPPDCEPVKLTGRFESGQVLIADRSGPRLGLRWRRFPSRKSDDALFRRLIRAELGDNAARNAHAIDPPGESGAGSTYLVPRSPDSSPREMLLWRAPSLRVLQIVHHLRDDDELLQSQIAPSLVETVALSWQPWAVFGLRCEAPRGSELERHELNAGDLSLRFKGIRGAMLMIRQISPARLALARRPIEKWLATQADEVRHRYQPEWEGSTKQTIASHDALSIRSSLRRRFAWTGILPRNLLTLALHDVDRDRLLLVQGSNEAIVREALQRMIAARDAEGSRGNASRRAGTRLNDEVVVQRTRDEADADDKSRAGHQRILRACPARAAGARVRPIDSSGKWQVIHDTPSGKWIKLLGAPPRTTRTFELDEVGKFVWDACDGRTSVDSIVESLVRDYSLHRREVELATIEFIRTLARRGLVK